MEREFLYIKDHRFVHRLALSGDSPSIYSAISVHIGHLIAVIPLVDRGTVPRSIVPDELKSRLRIKGSADKVTLNLVTPVDL